MKMTHFRPLATTLFLLIAICIQMSAQITPPLGLNFGDTRSKVTSMMESRPGVTLFSDKTENVTYLGGRFFDEPVYLFIFMFNSDDQLWATSILWNSPKWAAFYETICAKVTARYPDARTAVRTGHSDELVGREWNMGSTKILVYVDKEDYAVHLMHMDSALMYGKRLDTTGSDDGGSEDDI